MSINGGETAEQMVRILLDGTERTLRIVGDGARELAAFLSAWSRSAASQDAGTGKTNLKRLLRSGQALHVIRLKAAEYAAFRPQAREFCLLYAALRNKTDPEGCVDLVVREDEIPRVNHILERIGYARPREKEAEASGQNRSPSRSDSSGPNGRPQHGRQVTGTSSERRGRVSVRESLETYRRAAAHAAPTRERGRAR